MSVRLLSPFLLAIHLACLTNTVWAEVEPVAVRIDQPTAWVGERISFFVELRSAGSFSGSASFDLPQLPGAMVLKIGSPVVASKDFDGKSWFVQSHEFALFSQRSGTLSIPDFSVRFSCRDDFTGPVNDVQAECAGFDVEIKRPPASEQVPFLITTDSFEVSETWEPLPGPAEFGAIFKRTITQRSQQIPGMALNPAPTESPEGIRVYPGQPVINDKLQRGEFQGERSETITYMLQQSGEVALPSIDYVWWNPDTETLESKSLPSVTISVTARPQSEESLVEEASNWLVWSVWGVLILLCGLALWQWRRLQTLAHKVYRHLNPPDRVAARQLLKACRHDDAQSAESAWSRWRNMQTASYSPDLELAGFVLDLERHLFGKNTEAQWSGAMLAESFKAQMDLQKEARHSEGISVLPELNPTGPFSP